MDREEMNPEDIRLEQNLRQFAPRPSSVDRDRLMFLAGQQSAGTTSKRSHWLWPAATLSMSTVAACFAVAFVWQLSREAEVRIVVREVPAEKPMPAQVATVNPQPGSAAGLTPIMTSTPVSLDLPATSVLQLRNFALRFGVEALPAEHRSSPASALPPSPIDRWQQLRDAAPPSDSSL